MVKSKKFSILICSFLLVIASIVFVACGKLDYSKTYLSSNEEYIELFVGEEKELAISIINPVSNMNRGINFTQSNPIVSKITQQSNQNDTTVYMVQGLSGGSSSVEFTTIEGRKSTTVTIYVKEFSDVLTKGDNGLYISKSTILKPTSTDFKFKESSTERDLEYYFYGINNVSGSLTLDDVSSNDGLVNNFVSASLYTIENNDYLIFTDKDGFLHTLGSSTQILENQNVRYEFIDVQEVEGYYEFDLEKASIITEGMRFTFIAKYENAKLSEETGEGVIICEREFSVLNDIVAEDFSHEYGYKIDEIEIIKESFETGDIIVNADTYSYKIDDLKNGKITLIPNYKTTIETNPLLVGKTANYLTAYLELSVKTNMLLKYNFKTAENYVANSKIIAIDRTSRENEGITTYYIEVNCGVGAATTTSLDLNFYYEGFENSEDSKVNFTYSIPIEIRIIPTSLLINNVDFSAVSKKYTFYNSYATLDAGWQEFNFAVIPEGAEYENLVIDLTDSDLQIKYMNEIYTTGLFEIKDLKEPVYVKGGHNATADASENPESRYLPVSMDFNIIQQDSLKTNIEYVIVPGAKSLNFKTETFANKIYLEKNSGEVVFQDLYADASFTSISFKHNSGNDIVRFTYDSDDFIVQEGLRYFLKFKLLPRENGSATYTISLDNGVQIPLTVEVRESLNSLSLETTNEDNSVKMKEDQTNYSLVYLLNRNGRSYFDVTVVANDNKLSTAITDIDPIIDSPNVTIQTLDNNKYLIYSSVSGNESIIFRVQGSYIENFERKNLLVDYIVELVTYELAEDIYVYKLSDGFNEQYPENSSANYADVYSNAYNNALREVKLNVALRNNSAYLFQNPNLKNFVASGYTKEFLYFESDSPITKNGKSCDRMYYSATQDNVYNIGSYGTFDTDRLIFSAFSNVANTGRIRLIAHLMQYNKLYSFTININISIYNEVERITLQEVTTELNFSVINKEHSVIAYPTNANATNSEIVALFSRGQIVVGDEGDEDKKTYYMFDKSNISYIQSAGKTQITFEVNQEFLANATQYTGDMSGQILIVAKDWLDSSGNLRSGYSEYAVPIRVNFENGTPINRFTINNVDELIAVKDNLSAHYQIKTTIDISTISGLLPLGEFKGSIIGTNEYACISGIKISKAIKNSASNESYYGLFSSISKDAYIEYVQFNGEFDIDISVADGNTYIGLVAGKNYGKLINVGASIAYSKVNLNDRAGHSSFGGLVGENNGEIVQDFTLFENDNSQTRSENVDNLKAIGRLPYSGKTPRITVMMNDFVNFNYYASSSAESSSGLATLDRNVGGVAGANKGIIKKIDSSKFSVLGYTNYMAYSLLKVESTNIPENNLIQNVYVGGLVGKNGDLTTTSAQIFGGYNKLETNQTLSNVAYSRMNSGTISTEFDAGKGILVGGEVRGAGYVGGVVGSIVNISNKNYFTGITTRTFVRGLLSNTNTALIANISNDIDLTNAFAVQAIDDGRILEESAMIVMYSDKIPNGLVSDSNVVTINQLGFGNAKINALNNGENSSTPVNVFSFVSRNYLTGGDSSIISASKEYFYGDFLIVGMEQNVKKVVYQTRFVPGDKESLSINAKFNNKMTSSKSNLDIFYGYYFGVSSVIDNDITTVQEIVNSGIGLNRLTTSSTFYPFEAKGEMTFSSKSTDILTIDQTGAMIIKKTGLALITASSILNSNDALSFYIYVVNYFNSEYIGANENKSSIVYPTTSSSSIPVDLTTIELRGNNSASLYVLPNYSADLDVSLNSQNVKFTSDARGGASIGGIYFYLATNSEVSAEVGIYKTVTVKEDGTDKEIEKLELCSKEELPLDIDIVGQVITIRRLENTKQDRYKLKIVPVLKLLFNNNEYTSETNKILNDVVVDYRFGALEVTNKNYNNVPIQTSKTIKEEISILSTDEFEEVPNYYIIGLDGTILQRNGSEDSNTLFKIDFEHTSKYDNGNGTYLHKYSVEIHINTNSEIFKDRYSSNIYGKYLLYIQASSNSTKSLCIEVDFEQTGVSSIIIDNYTSLKDLTDNLTISSDYAYPGETGMLSFTINPEDSDFDYLLIENDIVNYENGRASATFGLLSRLNNNSQDSDIKNAKLFEDSNIAGSMVARGLKITLQELISAYSNEKYYDYNGIVYLRYDIGSNNVIDFSESKINISVHKDDKVVYTSSKELIIKLQNFVAVEIEGKTGKANQGKYYMSYDVARGMKYKLNIESYGFRQDNISLVSSSPLGRITRENGSYYLTITEGAVDYTSEDSNVFEIIATASQQDGELVRTVESYTKITVFEYVVNYNNDFDANKDIVKGMGDGVINVQVGTRYTLSLDLFDFIEYSPSITGVVNKINEFASSLAQNGYWRAVTNLITEDQPDYRMAVSEDDPKNPRLKPRIGYSTTSQEIEEKNYYFDSEGLRITVKRTHSAEEKFYFFEFVGYFDSQNGVYVSYPITADSIPDKNDSNYSSYNRIETSFILSVYSTSSEESPLPIYTYSDLIKMQSGGYYILLNDITLPSVAVEGGSAAFTPLNGNFASFDGNGHSINFAGTYDMGASSEIGLFSTLSDESTVKNLIVNYISSADGNDLNNDANDSIYGLNGLRTVKFITSADSFVFGSIAAENQGIITNCQVYTERNEQDEYYLAVKADNALAGSSFIGGIAGRNSGYITNCGVSINAKAPFNLAGIVAQNNNKIAACYFKEGKLINNSQQDQHVAGMAIENSKDSQIITSYVSGEETNTNLYSHDSESYITSTLSGAGFVFNNAGLIKDCYTDIDLSKTSSDMAGFVFRNGGTIRNSFSLSILKSNTTASAGFARDNSFDNLEGQFENCYYFYQIGKSPFLSEDDKPINVSLYNVSYDGIQRLTRDEFAQIEKYFEGYSYDMNMSVKAVWFYSQGYQSNDFVEYIPTTDKIVLPGSDGNNQSNTVYEEKVMFFGLRRLTLVAPNVRTLSVKNFSYTEVDETSGNVTYHYIDDSKAPDRGSIHNPRLVYSATTLENEILNETASNNINTTNYRVLKDISYNEFEGHSGLYKVIYAGNFEGNGMDITGFASVFMDNRNNGGLFSQIGYAANKIGSVKNLSLAPKEIVFNNTNNVGVLAGTLKYGYIYDINVDSLENNLPSVSGLNFVGGIIGKAINDFEAKDIYSNTNVWAVYSPSNNETFIEGAGQDSAFSYAGGLIGFVGQGKVYNAHVKDIEIVTGSRAGFAFGGIGEGANVEYTFVDVKLNSKLRANHYAGYVVGEVAGNLKYAYVPNNGNIESTFANVPKAAEAVGGIAGKLSAGNISNALVEQNFRVTNNENETAIANVGGLVGIVVSSSPVLSSIKDSVVKSDISGASVLGGAVGTVSSALNIDGIAVKSSSLSILGQKANPYLGGIVGSLTRNVYAALDMKNCYSTSKLVIETYTTGVASTASVGGLLGNAELGKVPTLEYCYTTSTVEAEVYDSRALGENKDFAEYKEDKPEEAQFNYYITNQDQTKKAFKNVYYYGAQNGKTKYEEVNTFVTYKTRVKNAKIGLNINNYGVSSVEYGNKRSSSTGGLEENIFNNIFGDEYLVKKDNNLNESLSAGESVYYIDFPEPKFVYTKDNKTINFVKDSNTIDDYKYIDSNNNTITIKQSEHLLQKVLYRGSDGLYYATHIYDQSSIELNGKDGFIRLSDNKFIYKDGEIYKDEDGNNVTVNMTEKQIWKTRVNELSTLNIEDSFVWLKML